jgi:hypothetical protein
VLAVATLLVIATRPPVRAESPPLVSLDFRPANDAAAPPLGWEPLTFRRVARPTRYTLQRDADRWVLRAESEAGASGLYRPVVLDPAVYRVLTWRWRIDNLVRGSDPRHRAGDDYPARVYVAFRIDPARATLRERAQYGAYRLIYGRYPPRVALNYVWTTAVPEGTVLDSAYTDRAKIIVVRSGPDQVGRWVTETRDVYEDYRRVVGGAPPLIEGVALMTDTDDTGERAVAYYADIAFARGAP